MIERPPSTLKIFALNFVTLGGYFFYWCAQSRKAIHQSAKTTLIPTTWLVAVPMAKYWWVWRYSEALEHVSYKRIKGTDVFFIFAIFANIPLSLLYVLFDFIPDQDHYSDKSVLIYAAILVGVYCVCWIGSMAAFCAVTQTKINKLRTVAQK